MVNREQYQETQAQEPGEDDLCPKCHGLGLIETAIGGEWCYSCGGSGKKEKEE